MIRGVCSTLPNSRSDGSPNKLPSSGPRTAVPRGQLELSRSKGFRPHVRRNNIRTTHQHFPFFFCLLCTFNPLFLSCTGRPRFIHATRKRMCRSRGLGASNEHYSFKSSAQFRHRYLRSFSLFSPSTMNDSAQIAIKNKDKRMLLFLRRGGGCFLRPGSRMGKIC